jgi:predicted transcriptional regulator
LSLVIPESGYYEEAEALATEIKARMREDYDFVIRKYEDAIGLKKDIIKTIRDIGVAYGMNQKSYMNLGFLRRW